MSDNNLKTHIQELADIQTLIASFESRDDYKAYIEAKKLAKGIEGIVRMSAMALHLETGNKGLNTYVKIQTRKVCKYDADEILGTITSPDFYHEDEMWFDCLTIDKEYMPNAVGIILPIKPAYIILNESILKRQLSKGAEWANGMYEQTTEPYVTISKSLHEIANKEGGSDNE